MVEISEYTDIKNNTYPLVQTVLVPEDTRKEREAEILEELYRIFIKK